MGFAVVGFFTLDILLSFNTLQAIHEEGIARKLSCYRELSATTLPQKNSIFNYPLGRGSYQRTHSTNTKPTQ